MLTEGHSVLPWKYASKSNTGHSCLNFNLQVHCPTEPYHLNGHTVMSVNKSSQNPEKKNTTESANTVTLT